MEELTWNKIVRDSKKAGYREGASDGTDSNFQSSFDEGYKEGFRNGFIMGQYKAAIRSINGDEVELKETRKGNCILCSDKSLQEKPVSVLKESQTESTNSLIKKLHFKHPENKCIISLQNKLD